MGDREITFGADASDARYRAGDDDPTGGGNYVVAERLDGSGNSVDVLLEWDEVNGTWQSRGPVEMNGNDITGVGSLTADSVNTEKVNNDTNDVGLGFDKISGLQDNGNAELVSGAPHAFVWIFAVFNSGLDDQAVFALRADENAVLESSDPSGNFTTTEGNNGTVNVYYDGTNTRYEIENKRGEGADFTYFILQNSTL